MPGFVKHYSNQWLATEARRRSNALVQADIPTPCIKGGPGKESLCFERIVGQSGRSLAGDLVPLLSVVARLHRTSLPKLPEFDPFLRVRPRLNLPTKLPVKHILSKPVPQGNVTLHGDLHLGQFIRARDGKVWIVDLDDLAIGPPEADIANFAAHLGTSLPEHGIAGWADKVCNAWVHVAEPVDETVFARYLRIALLRRHLKLREAGRPDFETEILTYLRESSNFSIL